MRRTLVALVATGGAVLSGCADGSPPMPAGPPTVVGYVSGPEMIAGPDGELAPAYEFAEAEGSEDSAYDGALLFFPSDGGVAYSGNDGGTGTPRTGLRIAFWLKDCAGERLSCTVVAFSEYTT